MPLSPDDIELQIYRLRDQRSRLTDPDEKAAVIDEINALKALREERLALSKAAFARRVEDIADRLDTIRRGADLSAESAIARAVNSLRESLA